MNSAQEQSIKERIRTIARQENRTFAQLWQNLILERFLARLHRSKYKAHFILKGGTLLARYISLGRETRDLDFLVEKLPNAIGALTEAINHICDVDLDDAFFFERVKTVPLNHPHMDYLGAQIALIAKLGNTKTHVKIDLGFGDIVNATEYPLNLTSTPKGPLFESQIRLRCYPKEFIFAEKLETAIYRGSGNSRMKDYHDLHSLVSISECLDGDRTEKIIRKVFEHRQMSIRNLPLFFDAAAMEKLQFLWEHYQRELVRTQLNAPHSESFTEIVSKINQWLASNTNLCDSQSRVFS